MKNRKGLTVRLCEDDTHKIYKLYDTDILTYSNNAMTLNSGGFLTKHTKNCINDNLPAGYKVYQRDFEWYVDVLDDVRKFTDNMVISV